MGNINSTSSLSRSSNSLSVAPNKSTPEQQQKDHQIYVAIYDYTSRTKEDLGFKKGDLMRIIETADDGWWLAQLEDVGSRGYIPSNFVAKWKSLDAKE